MNTYKFRVYLANGRTVDVTGQGNCPSTAQALMEAQYAGCRVVWMGRV